MSTFSAAPQALGYLFQIRYALLKLLADESASIRIEALDDIEVTSGPTTQLLQLKHRAEGTTITNGSPDFWKTIRVWAEQIKAGDVDPSETTFLLLSTATAAPTSVASLLKDDDARDFQAALAKAQEFCATSSSKELAPAIKAFNALTQAHKEALFSRITVSDGAFSIADDRAQVEGHLKAAVARQHRSALADRVEGWWLNICIQHLLGLRKHISGFELFDQITFLAQQFTSDSLPVDCYGIKPDAAQAGQMQRSVFVEQLEWLGVSSSRIQNAVLDYYRAFTQRSRWVKDQLLVDSELQQYEERLYDEWNRVRIALEETLSEPAADAALIDLGKKLLAWAEFDAKIPIRPKVTESYVMRGSFHMLADETPPRIRWHRNFASKMKAAIAQGAE